MKRVWWVLNLVFWRKEQLLHARGKAPSPRTKRFLQGRGRPFSSSLHQQLLFLLEQMRGCHGQATLFFPPWASFTYLSEWKIPPRSGKAADGTDMMWKSHWQEKSAAAAKGELGQGAREIPGVWSRNHCWKRIKKMRHLKQPELWQNRTSGKTNTSFFIIHPYMNCQRKLK